MEEQALLLSLILLAINLTWGIAYYCSQQKRKSALSKLREKYVKSGNYANEDSLEDEVEQNQVIVWCAAIAICLDIWIVGAMVTHCWATEYFIQIDDKDNAKALFGDSFGAVNALISAFAFAGMIVAFVLQRTELKLQRKEIKAQREEFEQQNRTLALQRFENTFFNMMELQQQIVNDLSVQTNRKVYVRDNITTEHSFPSRHEELVNAIYTGRQFFFYLFTHKGPFEDGLGSTLILNGITGYEMSADRSFLDHYFRHLYTILKFINESKDIAEFEDKYKYATFLRATLSPYELVLLFYNGLSSYGNLKLKPLLEKYCMLKNLDSRLLVLNKDSLTIFGDDADNEKAVEYLRSYGLSGTDFELMQTDERNVSNKYNLSAFYHSDEDIENGKLAIQKVFDLASGANKNGNCKKYYY